MQRRCRRQPGIPCRSQRKTHPMPETTRRARSRPPHQSGRWEYGQAFDAFSVRCRGTSSATRFGAGPGIMRLPGCFLSHESRRARESTPAQHPCLPCTQSGESPLQAARQRKPYSRWSHHPLDVSAGMPYLHPKNTPLALMFIVRSQTFSSVEIASSSWECMIPALLNSTFNLPNSSSATATMRSQSAARETSART